MTFEAIYREHFTFVWRALRRLGVREADAADAAQEVFMVVHRKLAEFEGRSKVTTWLYGICFRVASDRRRVASARHEINDERAVERAMDGTADATASVERARDLRLLERLLDALPIEQRAVFTLFELDGLRCEDIAELVGIPVGTVYSRLRLARAAFDRAAEALMRAEARRLDGVAEARS